MYRVYPSRYQRRWIFEGRLQGDHHLSLIYHSIGEDYGSNGTISLGILNRWLWCGAFQQIPDPERGLEMRAHVVERRGTRRIGPDFTEESLIEWVAADSDPDDAVRGFLASIPVESPAAPSHAAEHLPSAVRRILMESPPFPSRLIRGLQAVAAQDSLGPIYAGELVRRATKARSRPWESPSRRLLGLDKKRKKAG
jgi:hypothetical protein